MSKEDNLLNGLKHRLVTNSHKNDSKYANLNELCDQTDGQYWSRETRIPWRAICLALFLFVVGSALIVLSLLILSGFVETIHSRDQLFVLLFLGLLMFVPGFYHMRIAFYAYYHYEGFTFDHIPDFD